MNKKLLIGIIVVFVIAVIVVEIWARAVTPLLFLAVLIFLVWNTWKKKISLFRDRMEPKLAERSYKRLKALLWVAVIGFAMFWVNILLMFAIFRLSGFPSTEEEEGVFFIIGFISAVLFLTGTIGGLFVLSKGQQKTT